MPVYLTLQPIRRAARHLAVAPGGLLPRLFTLALPVEGRAVVFCHVVSAVARGFPLESMVLCVARTFLDPRRADAREDRDGPPGCLYYTAKLRNFALTAKE